MATTAEALFRDNPVDVVRDRNLQLSQDIARAKDDFDRELGARYGDVLLVTDEVQLLLQHAKEIDANLMNLCFDDASYKLAPVPEPRVISAETTAVSTAATTTAATAADAAQLQIASYTLAVTDWTLAVKEFVKDPSSAPLFDALFEHFHILHTLDPEPRYTALLDANCALLEETILQQDPQFTASQWVRLYDLFHSKNGKPFHFQNTCAFDELAFEFLLRNEEQLQTTCSDPSVHAFLKGDAFKAKFREKVLQDLEAEFHNFEVASNVVEPPVQLYKVDCEDFLNTFVHDVSLYCSGLVNEQDRKLHVLVETVINLLHKLQRSQADSECIKSVKARILGLLQERKKQLVEEEAAKNTKELDTPTVQLQSKKDSGLIEIQSGSESESVKDLPVSKDQPPSEDQPPSKDQPPSDSKNITSENKSSSPDIVTEPEALGASKDTAPPQNNTKIITPEQESDAQGSDHSEDTPNTNLATAVVSNLQDDHPDPEAPKTSENSGHLEEIPNSEPEISDKDSISQDDVTQPEAPEAPHGSTNAKSSPHPSSKPPKVTEPEHEEDSPNSNFAHARQDTQPPKTNTPSQDSLQYTNSTDLVDSCIASMNSANLLAYLNREIDVIDSL